MYLQWGNEKGTPVQCWMTRTVYGMYIVHVCYCSMNYDVFADESPVESSALQPARKLQWNISPETAADIETASRNMDKLAECM